MWHDPQPLPRSCLSSSHRPCLKPCPFPTPALYICPGSRATSPAPNTSPSHTREGMHCYSYDGCDSDSPTSDPLSGSDSEASNAQPQRLLVIFLDEDDDDEVEQPVHPLPSHRPKRPLPKNFSRNYHSPMKEETVKGTETPRPEVYHTISCTPGLRDKSLEVRLFPAPRPAILILPQELRVECYRQSEVATREPPKPVSSGMGGIPPNFLPWRESERNTSSFIAGQVRPLSDFRHPAELIRRRIG